MSDQIVAEYDRLEQLANRFANNAQTIQQMIQSVRSGLDNLEGEWIGRGSTAFFTEMESEILPATYRLQHVLEEANQVTSQIIRVMAQADNEAATPFRDFVL